MLSTGPDQQGIHRLWICGSYKVLAHVCGFWIHNSQRSAQNFIRVVIIRIEEFLLTFFFSKIIVSFRIKNKLISVKLKSVTNDSNLKKARVMTTTSSWLHYKSTAPRPAWRTVQNHQMRLGSIYYENWGVI